MLKYCIPLFAVLSCVLQLGAEIQPATLFKNGMVLQCEKPIQVWGKADPGEHVTVQFASQKVGVTANEAGDWRIVLEPLPVNHMPQNMMISGSETITISDILIGEVWLCSGQSNMVWQLYRSSHGEEEIKAASFPGIRYFDVGWNAATRPQDRVPGQWKAVTPDIAGDFSAVAYLFAKKLHQELEVPIGIIDGALGGTPVEAWTPLDVLASDPEFQPVFDRWAETIESFPRKFQSYQKALERWDEKGDKGDSGEKPRTPMGPDHYRMPTGLFNAMIHPLIPYTIKGVLWYQGEGNTFYPHEYDELFKAMINSWRSEWGEVFPFYFVQLPNYARRRDETGAAWAILRQEQSNTLELLNTGMAVTIDVGEADNLHPPDKHSVADRLVRMALNRIYDVPTVDSGPVPIKVSFRDNSIIIEFKTFSGSLNNVGRKIKGFELIGEKGKTITVLGHIINSSKIKIEVPEDFNPASVRYAWENAPVATIFNTAGLPAAPFSWEIRSCDVKN